MGRLRTTKRHNIGALNVAFEVFVSVEPTPITKFNWLMVLRKHEKSRELRN